MRVKKSSSINFCTSPDRVVIVQQNFEYVKRLQIAFEVLLSYCISVGNTVIGVTYIFLHEETKKLENDMNKMVVSTKEAPAAVGPYSQAIRTGNMVFTAGQIPLDPTTGKMLEDDITIQTEQVLKNLTAVLEAAGSSLDNVVKCTVFLQDMGEFGAMNAVYAQFFTENPPARSAVQAAALPLGARVEIEAIALVAS